MPSAPAPVSSGARRRRCARAVLVGLVAASAAILLGTPHAGAQVENARGWVPTSAESLQDIADAVERARRERSGRRERDALLRMAERLLDEVPDGGFPIGAGRWIGPGAYLAAAAGQLSDTDRARFTQDLDLLLEARLDRATESAPVDRWLRDLPVSDRFDPLRGRVVANLLEAGRAQTWLDRTRAGWPALAAIDAETVARWIRRPDPEGPAEIARPWAPVLSVEWPAPGNPRSPWQPGALRVEPALAGTVAYTATPDGVHCWETATATERWFAPFVSDAPPTLPGSVRRPELVGSTVVVSTERGVVGLDRDDGTVRWQLRGPELFPSPAAEDEFDEEERDDVAEAGSPILAISPPVRTEAGAVVAVSRITAGSVDLRVLLIDPEGRVRWNRDAGSASGATHLALGSVLPAPAALGDRVTVSTQRGSLVTLSLLDGSLIWAVPYPAYGSNASRDALRNAPRPRDARIAIDDAFLYSTALDASTLDIRRRTDGALHASIPLSDLRWWALAPASHSRDDSRRLLLLSADRGEVWEVEPAGVRAVAEHDLDPGLPRASGTPVAVSDGWWVPHRSGVLRLDREGRLTEVVDLAPQGPVRGLAVTEDRLLVSGDGFVELRAPGEARPGSLATLWGPVARGELERLPASLPQLDRDAEPEVRGEEERVARTILWQLRRPGSDTDLRLGLVPAAVARVVRLDQRVRVAIREAIAAARRGEDRLVAELCWLALEEGDPRLPVSFTAVGAVPVEVAVRQLLSRIGEPGDPLPDAQRFEERAEERLLLADRANRLERWLDLALRCPGTEVGRRAALDAAEELYRYGNFGRSLDLLERLVLFEPDNAEAVEARFRLAELSRETAEPERAVEVLEELRRDYGSLTLTVVTDGIPREVSVEERARTMLEAITEEDRPRGPGVVALPLDTAWRTRTEMEHLRNLHVARLGPDSPLYLTISRRSIELRDARTGDRVWHRTLPPLRGADRLPTWSDIGRLREPIAIDGESVWLTDRRDLMRVDLSDGDILWRRSLPPLPIEDGGETVPDAVEEAAAGDGVIVAIGNAGEAHAFDAKTGRPLWQRPVPGPLEGPPSIENGRVLLGINSPARVELWSLADGEPVWSLDVESLGTTLAQEPFFVPRGDRAGRDVLVSLERGELRRVDPDAGRTVWLRSLPYILRRVHAVDDPRFWIAQLDWSDERPMLSGFDPETGDVLWQKTFEAEQRRLHQVALYDGDLYLVLGDFNERRVICLQVPRAFPIVSAAGGEPPRELRMRWRQRLTQSFDVPRLRAHQDWILLEDWSNCDLTILSRETGIPILPREGFEAALEFLRGRQRLFFAGFIDQTLVLHTARGGIGLRAEDEIAERAALWARLSELPLDEDEPAVRRPISDSLRSYRLGRPDEAVRILEETLAEPGLDRNERRRLLYRLEALAQELDETSPNEWRIPRVETPPEVDGSLEEAWNAAVAWPVEDARYFHPLQGYGEDGAAWTGARDLSMTAFAAWSDVGFHLALDVQDDSVHPYDRDLEYWNGDCLLLAFDMLGDGGPRPDGDDMLLTLALTVPKRPPPGDPPPAEGEGEGEGDPPPPPPDEDDDPRGAFQVQRKADGSGVIYEVMIPWETFREARGQESIPHPGMVFRMNLVLADDDTGNRSETFLTLSTGQLLGEETRRVWNVFTPSLFPQIILGR